MESEREQQDCTRNLKGSAQPEPVSRISNVLRTYFAFCEVSRWEDGYNGATRNVVVWRTTTCRVRSRYGVRRIQKCISRLKRGSVLFLGPFLVPTVASAAPTANLKMCTQEPIRAASCIRNRSFACFFNRVMSVTRVRGG
jgi:hypothetical protein